MRESHGVVMDSKGNRRLSHRKKPQNETGTQKGQKTKETIFCKRENFRSLLQKSPTKETIFCKRDRKTPQNQRGAGKAPCCCQGRLSLPCAALVLFLRRLSVGLFPRVSLRCPLSFYDAVLWASFCWSLCGTLSLSTAPFCGSLSTGLSAVSSCRCPGIISLQMSGYIQMSHGTHTNQLWRTYKQVMAHIT